VAVVNRSYAYGFGPFEGTRLLAWLMRARERESVKQTFVEFEKGLAGLRDPAVREVYLSGARKREYRDHRLEWMVKSGGIEVVLKGLEKGNIRFSWP
jgi:stringent starvation protein A